MPKIVDYEKVRQHIIDKAMDVFSKKGYHGTNLSHIALSCGMGRTTLYQYFKNKDDIFEQVMEKILDDLEEECKHIMDQPELSVIDKIKKIFGHLFSQCQSKRSKIGILLDLWILIKLRDFDYSDGIGERVLNFRKMFYSLLKEGIDKKEIKALDMESMSSTLYNLLETSVIKLSAQKVDNYEGYLNNLHILIDGLKA